MDLNEILGVTGRIPMDWIELSPGEQLLLLRKGIGISQRHLADAAGLDHAVVTRVERGADARFETWKRLFEALGYCAVLAPVDVAAEEMQGFLTHKRGERWLRQQEGLDAGRTRYRYARRRSW